MTEQQKAKQTEQMSPEAREKYRQYQRSYRRRNPQRVAEWSRRYWEKKARGDTAGKKAEA